MDPFLYYSLVTLSTLGYGDIVAGPGRRALSRRWRRWSDSSTSRWSWLA
jgi:hypothetical protein